MICPICNHTRIVSLREVNEYWHCRGCGVAWRKKLQKTTYKEDYYAPASSAASIMFRPLLNFFYFLRSRYSERKQHGLWIDVGAGDGNFVSGVDAKRKIGVEGSLAAREIMKKKGIRVLGDASFLQKRGLAADVISFWHVLEHLVDPEKFLLASFRNLKKSGELIVAVPNIDSFEFGFFERDWFHLEPKLHLWHFSPKSIKILLRKCGFRIKRIDYFSIEHHSTGLLQSFINKGSSQKNSLHKLVKSIRQTDAVAVKASDVLVNLFWLTLGLPIIFIVWIINSLTERSGTFVIVAVKR